MRKDAVVLRTSLTAAAATVVVALTLAACGPLRLGAAAITGDQSISSATLTSQVSNLTAAYKASGGRIQYQFPASQAPREVLAWLVRFKVRDQLAAREHITVTRAATQKALASLKAQAKNSGTTLTDLAVANGLPPDLLGKLGRFEAIQLASFRKLSGGSLPSSSSALNALSKQFSKQQCLAAKSLHITINPQFGRLDYSQLTVIAAPSTLSAPEVSPSPSATPQLTPPC